MAAAMPIWATVTARTIAAQRPRARPGRVGAPGEPGDQHAAHHQEGEGEDPMGPVQRGQGRGRREDPAVAERKAQAQEPGVKVGHLGAEQDHHEPEPGGRQHQAVPAVSLPGRAAGRSRPAASPARSATTRSVARRTIALARWTMTTQGGRTSLTVMAPRRTWTTSSTAARVAGPRRAGSARCRRQATSGHGEDEEAHQGGGPPVADLDQGREVERGEPLAVTKGPMIPAPHAGAGDPHHPTQNDQPERQSRSGPGQPPEETGVGMGLETQGIRPPQVSAGKERCAAVPCQRYI